MATPFFPQEAHQCGPAALATVLTASGVPVTPAELSPQVYVPALKGSLQVELMAAARRYGRLPYPIDPKPEALYAELQERHPVLVLQNLGSRSLPAWHYAVVVGFDPGADEIVLRSGTRKRELMTTRRFLDSWSKGGFWGLVMLRPGELPARPDHDTYVDAVAALEVAGHAQAEAKACVAGLQRWPRSAKLLLGLGNARYVQRDFVAAESAYRGLLQRYPDNAVGYNNLAQALRSQGRYREALAAVDQALAVKGARDELRLAFQRTRREIRTDRAGLSERVAYSKDSGR